VSALAIVIPAYRSERTVALCLERFRDEAPDAQIVVVDSAPDGASAAVARRFPGVQAIHSRERLLPHAARNLGARATTAPLVLFTDPDIYPKRGSVATLLEAQHALGGAVVAAVASYGRSTIDLAAHTAKFGLWLPRPGVEAIDSGPSSGSLVRRNDWAVVGGIPEDGMLGDTLFCWALVDAGIPLHLAGEAIFEHDHGTTYRDLVRERFLRGREFATLRRRRWPGSRQRAQDVATTVSLFRPVRVTARSMAAAQRDARPAEALLTLPVVASAHFAWFAGELAGLGAATRRRVGDRRRARSR